MTQSSKAVLDNKQIAIGIDIGGTKVSAARVHPGNHAEECVQGFIKQPTPTNPEDFLAALTQMIEALSASELGTLEVGAVGIATAGIVDPVAGSILGSTGNIPFLRQISQLKALLESKVSLPVTVENDANAAAYGEYKQGAGSGVSDLLMITLGTGVGGGIILNGELVHGGHCAAAEVGHIAVSMSRERLCTCGKWGCWEAYASGTGLALTAQSMLRATPNASASRVMMGQNNILEVNTHQVIEAAEEGDPLALKILSVWHEHIATGLGSLINVLDPGVIVIGGGMAPFVNLERLTQLTNERAMLPPVDLRLALLGNHAGLVGAAHLALEAAAVGSRV